MLAPNARELDFGFENKIYQGDVGRGGGRDKKPCVDKGSFGGRRGREAKKRSLRKEGPGRGCEVGDTAAGGRWLLSSGGSMGVGEGRGNCGWMCSLVSMYSLRRLQWMEDQKRFLQRVAALPLDFLKKGGRGSLGKTVLTKTEAENGDQ